MGRARPQQCRRGCPWGSPGNVRIDSACLRPPAVVLVTVGAPSFLARKVKVGPPKPGFLSTESRSAQAGIKMGSKWWGGRPILAWADRLSVLRTMVLGRPNDSGRPQTRGIDQNVPRGVPGTPSTALLGPSAAQTTPCASQQFWLFLFRLSQDQTLSFKILLT